MAQDRRAGAEARGETAWGLPDPATAVGSDDERLQAFRDARDELQRRLAAVFRP